MPSISQIASSQLTSAYIKQWSNSNSSSSNLNSLLGSYGTNQSTSSKEIKAYVSDLKQGSSKVLAATKQLKKSNVSEDKMKALSDLVEGYNQMVQSANKYDEVASIQLKDQLGKTSNLYSGQLSRIGINVQSNGTMKLDEEKIKQAAEDGTLDQFITSSTSQTGTYGFLSKLEHTATKINEQPMNYMVSEAKLSLAGASVGTYNIHSSSNNYISQIIKYNTTSTLFDAMF